MNDFGHPPEPTTPPPAGQVWVETHTGPQPAPPRRRLPRMVAVPAIIALNVVVYLLWQLADGSPALERFLYVHFTTNWTRLSAGYFWTLETSVFSHAELWHIGINMLVFLSFGRILEMMWGPWRLLGFYLGAGAVASLTHCLLGVLGWPLTPALGASGAVTAVVLVFVLMFPHQKLLFFGIIPMPAWFAAIAAVGIDLAGLIWQREGGASPLGHGAHLGGAAFGTLFFFLSERPRLQRLRERRRMELFQLSGEPPTEL